VRKEPKRNNPMVFVTLSRAKATVGTEDFIVELTTNVIFFFFNFIECTWWSSSLSLAGIGF
jgi:hypothetical protein